MDLRLNAHICVLILQCRARVREIITRAGPDHVVVSTTGTPLEAIDEMAEANYHALIDAVQEFGAR